MGIFDRFFNPSQPQRDPAGFDPSQGDPSQLHAGQPDQQVPPQLRRVAPVRRIDCSCVEHVEDLLGLTIPYTAEMDAELGEEPMTVGDLLECGALDVHANEPDAQWLSALGDHGHLDPAAHDGPFHWMLWVGDEARAHYDDEADLQLDESLLQQPGFERVVWEDREVFHVGADGLCRSGVLAAAARALADPRVRIS